MNLPQYPALTEDVIESAEWRADVLNLVRESLRFRPANLNYFIC